MADLVAVSAPTPLLSVIMAVSAPSEGLARRLQALVDQVDGPSLEVLVVGPGPELGPIVEHWGSLLDIRMIETPDHDPARRANAAAAAARGAVLAFVSERATAEPRWAAGLAESVSPGVAEFAAGTRVLDRGSLPRWVDDPWLVPVDGPGLVRVGHGVWAPSPDTLAVTAAAFAAVGGFDPTWSGRGAAFDLALRLYREGYRLGVARHAVCVEHLPSSARELRQRRRDELRAASWQQARLGQASTPPTRARCWYRALRHGVGQSLRRREVDPRRALVRIQAWLDRDRVRRQVWRAMGPSAAERRACEDVVLAPEVPVVGGLALQCRPELTRWWFSRGPETVALTATARLLGPGQTFVDCGANIGVFTLLAARCVGPSGRVVAFEPAVAARQLLRANLARHGASHQVDCRAEALGAVATKRTFYTYANDALSGFSEAPLAYSPGALLSREPVDVVALDDVVPGAVGAIKIDIEGGELDLLAGARALLARSTEAFVIFECNPLALRRAGRRVDELLAEFADGWHLWQIDEATQASTPLVELDDQARERLVRFDVAGYVNVLAVRASRRGEVSALARQLARSG